MAEALTLTLIRHAKSSWQFSGLDDFHRPLNRRGLHDSTWMPAHIAKRIDTPQVVFCSAAARAVQTCMAVCEEYDLAADEVVVDADLYLASAQKLLACVQHNAHEARHVFVIAHNPGLTELFNFLVAKPIANLPTFAVAHLSLSINDWSAVNAHRARVQHLLLPKELRAQ